MATVNRIRVNASIYSIPNSAGEQKSIYNTISADGIETVWWSEDSYGLFQLWHRLPNGESELLRDGDKLLALGNFTKRVPFEGSHEEALAIRERINEFLSTADLEYIATGEKE